MKKNICYEANVNKLGELINELEDAMKANNWASDKMICMDVCAEEIFVNIAQYAYVEEGGSIDVIIEIDEKQAKVSFIDSGKKYNPLEKEDPDITLSAQERKIGGLGVYMVKKMMDEVGYRYEDGKNHFVMALNR